MTGKEKSRWSRLPKCYVSESDYPSVMYLNLISGQDWALSDSAILTLAHRGCCFQGPKPLRHYLIPFVACGEPSK